MMTAHTNRVRLQWACIIGLLVAACSDDPPTGILTPPRDTAQTNALQSAISDPVASASPSTVDGNAVPGVVYVAFAPGELGNAHTVRITNVSVVAAGSSEHIVMGGALDPVAITASVGDTIELIATMAGGARVAMRAAVPRRRAPRVVRVDPPKGRTDVALNSKILVVFSEPIDPTSVTSGNLSLTVSGQAVAGSFIFGAGPTLSAEFVGTAPLSPGSSYTITTTQGIRDLSGDALEQSETFTFSTTTATTPPPSTGPNIRVTTTTTGVDIPESFMATMSGITSPIPSNGFVTFTGVPLKAAYEGISFYVILSGLPDHCNASSANPRAVPMVPVAGQTYDVGFTVLCDRGGVIGPVATQELAFVRGSDVFTIQLDGTNEVRITDTGENYLPAWSPDGRRLAFSSYRDFPWPNIYTINADGSNLSRRTTYFADGPAWSPDGKMLAYSSWCDGQGCILVTSADGISDKVRLGHPAGQHFQPAWSPDGSKIAFVSDWRYYDIKFDIYIANSDGTGIKQLTNGPGPGWDIQFPGHPAWSPDGSKIAFVYSDSEVIYPYDMRFKVAVMNADGTGVRRDVAWAGDIPWREVLDPGSIAWSPDGSRIAYSFVHCDLITATGCSNMRSIRSVALDGSGDVELVKNAHSPSWRR
jgi:hypothetical protein